MKRNMMWLAVSSLIALSLVIAACAPSQGTPTTTAKPTTPKTVTTPTVPTTPTEEKKVAAPPVEKPKYGGVLNLALYRDLADFDDIVGRPHVALTQQATNESLSRGDWSRGPAGGYGTNETDWGTHLDVWEFRAGEIAESWELPSKVEGDKAVLIYRIRKGIRWALNPASEASRLVGGRELTVDDVVFSLKRVITDPRSYVYKNEARLRTANVTSPAPWTVKIEVPWDAYESAMSRLSSYTSIVPPEVVGKFSDMRDWKVSVGTGPFMLTEFVPGTSATLVRNPNYWMKDPIGPGKGNQLPYLDGVKMLVIPDASTRFAALRTAKVDFLGGSGGGTSLDSVPMEDALALKKTSPQLMLRKVTNIGTKNRPIYMRLDKAPFNDIRVRQALMLAIDFEKINKSYYGGEAQILTYPIVYVKEYADAYLGLDDPEMPPSVKELYSYNPEKAKQLLKEAGYPNGFKTNLVMSNEPEYVDYHSIYKDMWSKVGIDVELRPKESGALLTLRRNREFDQMIENGSVAIGLIYKLLFLYGKTDFNLSDIDDPVINEAFNKIQSAVVMNRSEANRIHRELMKYILPKVWAIPTVTGERYTLWWPWIKNYRGEVSVGYLKQDWYRWVWLDQELKKSMGY